MKNMLELIDTPTYKTIKSDPTTRLQKATKQKILVVPIPDEVKSLITLRKQLSIVP